MSNSATLIEASKRRESFKPGVPIKLWDGQIWEFPRPKVRWRRTFGPDDVATVEGRSNLGPAFDEARAMMTRLSIGEQTWEQVAGAVLNAAALMLLDNYDLSDDELFDLLVFDNEDQENQIVWREILAVAWGWAPRA